MLSNEKPGVNTILFGCLKDLKRLTEGDSCVSSALNDQDRSLYTITVSQRARLVQKVSYRGDALISVFRSSQILLLSISGCFSIQSSNAPISFTESSLFSQSSSLT